MLARLHHRWSVRKPAAAGKAGMPPAQPKIS